MSERATPSPGSAFSSFTGWIGRLQVYSSSRRVKRQSSGYRANGTNTKKKYLAVVHGKFENSSGTITTYLMENKAHNVYSTSDATKGKLSHTAYTVLKETKDLALLEIDLLTGRKHQIHVHLAGIGHPVVGDRRYGKGNEARTRLALHARSISFRHPLSGEQLTFETKVPEYFNKLVGSLTSPWLKL